MTELESAIERLTAWLRDFGHKKSKPFTDDIAMVVEAAKANKPVQYVAISSMPHAYASGNNPWNEGATYSCGSCGLELYDEEVGFVAAGRQTADGEWAPCPRCNEENPCDRKDNSE